jgi:hypothetical protein
MAYRDLRATLKDLVAPSDKLSHEQQLDAKIQQILHEVAESTGLALVEEFMLDPNSQEDHTVVVYDKFSAGPRQ